MSIETIDFNALYMQQKEATTFKMKSVEQWDSKAYFMNKKVHKSIYNEQFIALLDMKRYDSLLDVGCGVGNLSLKLSAKLSTIYALDYSSKMLDALKKNANKEDCKNITTIQKSWYDDWKDVPMSDLVIASRSLEVIDMKAALIKLNKQAKKTVVLSYKVGGSFVSEEILNIMQREVVNKPDYIYLVNILYSLGINATVNFIESEGRSSIYPDCESFLKSVSWSIGELSVEEKKRLKKYYKEIVKNKKEVLDTVKWAIISWDKKE